ARPGGCRLVYGAGQSALAPGDGKARPDARSRRRFRPSGLAGGPSAAAARSVSRFLHLRTGPLRINGWRPGMKILLLAALAACAWGQTPDIETIMRRVALNQAKSQDLRTSYIYTQKQTLKMMRGNRKLAREEHREYTISPKVRGIDRTLVRFDGKYGAGNTFV